MKNRMMKKVVGYLTLAMLIAGSGVYVSVRGNEFITCCSYGLDCNPPGQQGPEMSCCFPPSQTADCSEDRPNYCKTGSCA